MIADRPRGSFSCSNFSSIRCLQFLVIEELQIVGNDRRGAGERAVRVKAARAVRLS